MNARFVSLLLMLLTAVTARAGFRTGQPADVMLNAPPFPRSTPFGVAVDPLTQKVFVVDKWKHRVLRYGSAAAMENSAEPEAVIGQPDLYDFAPRTSATGLRGPQAILVDLAGRLWVSDADNHRVLRFDHASSLPTGAAASGVLGQPDFTSSTESVAQNTVSSPHGLAMDRTGALWVADDGARRVLRFDKAAELPPGAPAAAVLGQTSFTAGTVRPVSAATFTSLSGIAIEHFGSAVVRLWVTDPSSHRVLGFNNPTSKSNGAPADRVLGKADFVSGSQPAGPLRNNMIFPTAVATQGGDLWVGDLYRVLRFEDAGAKPLGANADALLGQASFTASETGAGLHQLGRPLSIAISGERLWIGDALNKRLVRHEEAAAKSGNPPAAGTLGFLPGDSALHGGDAVAVDPASGKLFVCESHNNRILRYGSSAALQQGAAPEAVIGQVDFTGVTEGTSASRFHHPVGISVDRRGNLWVADSYNNRVLRFANASALTSGATATQVLGQATFTASGQGTAPSAMSSPAGVVTEFSVQPFVTQITRLWVADSSNNRVLRFENPLSLGNGAAASGVLGQPGLSSGNAALTATGLDGPHGLAVEGARLWVADRGNRRILRFENAAAQPNGAAAGGVLLQSGFTTRVGQSIPAGLAIDRDGRLFAASYSDHRVLWFNRAAQRTNGSPHDGVLGQASLTATEDGRTPAGLAQPWGVAMDPDGRLWISDRFYIRRYSPSVQSFISGYGFNAQRRFYLTIIGYPGETFEIHSSTDLQDWSTLEHTVTVPDGVVLPLSWIAPASPTGPRKFYRLEGR